MAYAMAEMVVGWGHLRLAVVVVVVGGDWVRVAAIDARVKACVVAGAI